MDSIRENSTYGPSGQVWGQTPGVNSYGDAISLSVVTAQKTKKSFLSEVSFLLVQRVDEQVSK